MFTFSLFFLSHGFSFREAEGLNRAGAETGLVFGTVLGQALGSHQTFQKTVNGVQIQSVIK